MTVSAENCRKNADVCWRAARLARDPDARLRFEDLANAWLRLADRAEREPNWRVQFIHDKKVEIE